jgi:hypothetical protein
MKLWLVCAFTSSSLAGTLGDDPNQSALTLGSTPQLPALGGAPQPLALGDISHPPIIPSPHTSQSFLVSQQLTNLINDINTVYNLMNQFRASHPREGAQLGAIIKARLSNIMPPPHGSPMDMREVIEHLTLEQRKRLIHAQDQVIEDISAVPGIANTSFHMALLSLRQHLVEYDRLRNAKDTELHTAEQKVLELRGRLIANLLKRGIPYQIGSRELKVIRAQALIKKVGKYAATAPIEESVYLQSIKADMERAVKMYQEAAGINGEVAAPVRPIGMTRDDLRAQVREGDELTEQLKAAMKDLRQIQGPHVQEVIDELVEAKKIFYGAEKKFREYLSNHKKITNQTVLTPAATVAQEANQEISLQPTANDGQSTYACLYAKLYLLKAQYPHLRKSAILDRLEANIRASQSQHVEASLARLAAIHRKLARTQ